MRKYITVFLVMAVLVIMLGACSQQGPAGSPAAQRYEDGIYRGGFFDRDRMHVGIQLTLKDNVVTDIRYRHLWYGGTDFLQDDSSYALMVRRQMEELAHWLAGRDIRESLPALYRPQRIIETEVDGLTAATVRSGKVISAVRDALNR